MPVEGDRYPIKLIKMHKQINHTKKKKEKGPKQSWIGW